MLGVSGAALGSGAGPSLRSSAGMQLVNLAVPLLADGDSGSTAGAGTTPASGQGDANAAGNDTDAAGNDAGAENEAVPAATGSAVAEAAEEAGTDKAGTDKAGKETAGPDQTAAEEAAAAEAEVAAAEAAARAAVPVDDPAAAKAYAASALAPRGWEASQLTCLDTLWTKESEWLTSATNASSGAYGIAQSLPAEKMATHGDDWQSSYRTQINWGLDYISSRYGSPCSALNFHYANNWY